MRRALVFPLALCISAACGSSPSPSSSPPPTGPVARFDDSTNPVPDFMAVPFPSDVYLQNGKVVTIPAMDAVVKQNATFISHELAKMDGFSRVALAMFYVDDTSQPPDADGNPAPAKLDPTTFPADEKACAADASSVFLVDLDATDPSKARVPCRGMLHQDYRLPTARSLVAIGPARGVVLAPAHHYAAVLTSRVQTTDHRALLPSADFRRVQKGDPGAPALYVQAYQKVTAAIGGALAKDGAQVVALAPYTTHDMARQLFALRDGIERAPAPTLAWDAASMAPMSSAVFAARSGPAGKLPAGATASLDDWLGVVASGAKLPDGSDDPDTNLPVRAHDRIAAVGTAVFTATNWLQHYTTGTYNDLDHATFATESGHVVPAPDRPTDKIWVSFAVPKTPMPASGYPVVVFQHGLGGTREDFLDVANPLCNQGWMVAAIDSITFGARAPEPAYQVDATSDFAAAPGAKYTGPDGFADAVMGSHNGSTDMFGILLDVGALRDQLRQAELDTAQLVRVLRSKPDLSGLALGGAAPAIDGARVAYLGQSLGAIEGAAAAAIEPNVAAWVLNVGGGGVLSELATHAPVVGTLLAEAGGLNFGFIEASFDEGQVFTNLVQTVVDPADPLDFAGDVVTSPQPLVGQPTKPRNVLQLEVVYDEWVANEANEALARAGGWGLAQPNVGSNAGILDVKNIDSNPGRLPLPSVPAQSDGSIHDTPVPGVTAVVVQESPATHGNNLSASTGQRQYCIPYASFASGQAFDLLDQDQWFTVPNPYRQTQATIARFLSDAFAGKVPGVVVGQAPVRDLDADGVPDDMDPAPCNPKVK